MSMANQVIAQLYLVPQEFRFCSDLLVFDESVSVRLPVLQSPLSLVAYLLQYYRIPQYSCMQRDKPALLQTLQMRALQTFKFLFRAIMITCLD